MLRIGLYKIMLRIGFTKVSSAGLERSYRRAPKGAAQAKQYLRKPPPGICHLCMGGTLNNDWENL